MYGKHLPFTCGGRNCKKLSAKRGLEGKVEIDSAGTLDYHSGESPDSRMIKHASKRGYSLDSKARQFKPEKDFEHFDYIITMDNDNYSEIISLDKRNQFADKVFKMVSFGNKIKADEVLILTTAEVMVLNMFLTFLKILSKVYLTELKMISEEKIKKRIEEKLGSKIKSFSSLSGGCISDAFKISTANGTSFFLKYNPSASNNMFLKEANGLRELDKSNAIKIPEVLSVDEDYILLEFIASGNRKKKFFEDFGKSFAEMHKFKSVSFGFYENNYIGSNPQINIPDEKEKSDWTAFYLNKEFYSSYN